MPLTLGPTSDSRAATVAPVTTPAYDVAAVRSCFPALAGGTAFFDGPGGSQVPESVGDAVRATLLGPISNRGQVTAAERRADPRRPLG